ncbi:multifunctional CCA tRNA nucleotidyl transferase/2'3'-cyclic phosphodiesterase/2'nucleotidase/phosphatase [Arsenophonus sp. ENCA]|uniref:multifunctional CCA addition/repair protein n=1 Tax=Arsenophonus sp. ENCA TaxID=1987579 RepID=UPI000BDD1E5A|nr:multifunctional CCA addition/repair protein [Arsenophonus sp. ENCA]PAV11353.1 multifunctional CCA tRNA nucleotidyl transferase/2'3'-cyclic phosphodiesterase/2'nucleotidase/phosphatase [Arsenophonus sp. ENCA]
MQIYLVGGAVRDQLLGLPVSDRDWVVVGATPDDLIKLGFQQVGKDFPVFLHPKTREEYALARTERKTGVGYTGFSCYAAPDVTIEEDLLRRDLTINAIAQTEDGQLIDPYNGERDIKNLLLRHVSAAFAEDPLRILRVARFAARLANQKFTIANETQSLMKKMVFNHEFSTISAERVWGETEKALQSLSPEIYFRVLYDCGALAILFPEINQLFGIPAAAKSHPEIDTLLTLKVAASLTDNVETRFAALCHDFGKALTPSEQYPAHDDYVSKGISLIEAMCNRLRIPNRMKELAKLVARFHQQIHQINQSTPETVINLFNQLDSWRKPERINKLVIACEADARSRIGREHITYPQAKFVIEAFKTVQQVSSKDLIEQGITGIAIRDELNRKRIQTLTDWWQQQTILPI